MVGGGSSSKSGAEAALKQAKVRKSGPIPIKYNYMGEQGDSI